MSVVVVGLNHRSVPLELLERMAVPEERLAKVLGDLHTRPFVSEVVVLSTCHRTEVYAVAERFHGAVQDIRNALGELAFLAPEDFSDSLYTYHDDAAVAHLFAVAAGLESVVLGESEILGQVKAAWEAARVEGAAGPRLGELFRQAVETGKRVRTETGIGRGVTSLSRAAVAMAGEHLGGLAGRQVLVLGAGEMGESMAIALARAKPHEILVANRTWERAVALAARIGGRAVGLDAVPDALAEVDLVLTSTGAPSIVVERDELEPAVRARGNRPLLFVDVALPRDIDPSVADLPGVTLLDLADLRAFVEAGVGARRSEVGRVREIVAEEVDRYVERVTAREVAPTIVALRAAAEDVRGGELERFRSRLAALDDRQREAVEALTRGIIGKLLHEPTVRLKESAGSPKGDRLAEALRELFNI